MPAKKYFECSACSGKHEKPIDEGYTFVDNDKQSSSDGSSDIQLGQRARDTPASSTSSDASKDISKSVGDRIFEKLCNMETRIASLESRD